MSSDNKKHKYSSSPSSSSSYSSYSDDDSQSSRNSIFHKKPINDDDCKIIYVYNHYGERKHKNKCCRKFKPQPNDCHCCSSHQKPPDCHVGPPGCPIQ